MKNLFGCSIIMLCVSTFVFSANKPVPAKKIIEKEVNGEVFIVTKDGNNVKLGLVSVYFVTPEQFKLANDTNSIQYKIGIQELIREDSIKNYKFYMKLVEYDNDLIKMSESINADISKAVDAKYEHIALAKKVKRFTTDSRVAFYSIPALSEIGKSNVISDVTNSDGKFKVKLKNQKYYVCANASRKISNVTEWYHWLIEYSPTDKTLLLSNNNLTQFNDVSRAFEKKED